MRRAFELLTGHPPMRWQERLYTEYFDRGELPGAVDVPTGLGKTAVMALWLLARGDGKALPRRLVYVVDRRAVVDQATTFASLLRERLDGAGEELESIRSRLGLTDARKLAISTLRGQHIDNQEWLEDPSAPAIIISTIDMAGSRLLFEGYGVSRKMRPYHAGLLGADTLVMLDEAHLVPPFERLVDEIERDPERRFCPRRQEDAAMMPPFRLLSLSATGRAREGNVFRLEDRDIEDDALASQRLSAGKTLQLEPLESNADKEKGERLASVAWSLTAEGSAAIRCLVFCNKRELATKVATLLAKKTKQKGTVELFVGARRGRERELAAKRLEELGFIAGSPVVAKEPAFLVATSAAEVGVDLDADHAVCDAVPWERTVQRLGRVNRRGGDDRTAQIRLVVEPDLVDRERSTIRLVQEHLPRHDDGGVDVSPEALRQLNLQATRDSELRALIEAATTAPPLRPELTRPALDAWSMTSLKEHTGRPEVAPWLRGWVEDLPQTRIAWRTHLPARNDGSQTDAEVLAFFEAAPPHASEMLATETHRVVAWLLDRASSVVSAAEKPVHETEAIGALSPNGIAAFMIGGAGDRLRHYTCDKLAGAGTKPAQVKQQLNRELSGATLVVDARLAGLDAGGSLESGHDQLPTTADGTEHWMPDPPDEEAPSVLFRLRFVRNTDGLAEQDDDPNWRPRLRFVLKQKSDDEVEAWIQIDKWHHDGAFEEDRSVAIRPQKLGEHQSCAAEEARGLASRLGLRGDYANALEIAARLHDEGKRAKRWQQAFRAPPEEPYAKTRGPIDMKLLAGYRHEFGSLPYAERDGEFVALPDDLRDLVLHLIAAHHGYARPTIGTDSCEDAPPSILQERARAVALRFTRLQQRWGPWGLAYWEALLRSADQRASRRNDDEGGQ